MLNKNYEANNEANYEANNEANNANNNNVDRDPILYAIDDMVDEETSANNENMDTDALYNEFDRLRENNQIENSDYNDNNNEHDTNQYGGGQRKTRKSSIKSKPRKNTNQEIEIENEIEK
jgi:hypothetical protein